MDLNSELSCIKTPIPPAQTHGGHMEGIQGLPKALRTAVCTELKDKAPLSPGAPWTDGRTLEKEWPSQ